MNKYLELIKNGTAYARRVDKLSRQIFGEVTRDTNQPSMTVVKRLSQQPFYENDKIVNYYPRLKETHSLMLKLRSYGLYRDEHLDFKEEMKRLRVARGKVTPKKGQGKQKMRNS